MSENVNKEYFRINYPLLGVLNQTSFMERNPGNPEKRVDIFPTKSYF